MIVAKRETTVIVLVGTLSIDDVELNESYPYPVRTYAYFIKEIETVGNGKAFVKTLHKRKTSSCD